MNDLNTLNSIKSAEDKSDLLISQAKEDYYNRIEKAKKEAKVILDEWKIKADIESKKIIKYYQEKTNADIDQMEKEHKELISNIKVVPKTLALRKFEEIIKKFFGV